MPFYKGHKINVGKKYSDERKDKIRKSLTGHYVSEETKNKIREKNTGKISDGTKKNLIKMANERRGKKRPPFSEEWKMNISKATKGKKVSDKFRKITSERMKGENNYFWKGGISFESYTLDWTETLRISIRERDKYICQICSKKQGDIAFCVHHIDYDKKNCNPDNLITLCNSCHSKTNGGNRKDWISYFTNKL